MSKYNTALPSFKLQSDLGVERMECLKQLPIIDNEVFKWGNVTRNMQRPDNCACWVYVVDWYWDDEFIYGIGECEVNGRCVRLKLDVQPGLFVACADNGLLSQYSKLNNFGITNTKLKFTANTFRVYDVLLDESVTSKSTELWKINTRTFGDALRLYYELKKNPYAYKFAGVCHYYDITIQILFELLWRNDDDASPRTC